MVSTAPLSVKASTSIAFIATQASSPALGRACRLPRSHSVPFGRHTYGCAVQPTRAPRRTGRSGNGSGCTGLHVVSGLGVDNHPSECEKDSNALDQGKCSQLEAATLDASTAAEGQGAGSWVERLRMKELVLLGGVAGMLPGLDLEGPGSVLEAIGVLALIVAVHEAGHFLAARYLGIHVSKFSVGFGPIIFKYQGEEKVREAPGSTPSVSGQGEGKSTWLGGLFGKGLGKKRKPEPSKALSKTVPGVEYSLRAFPLGGYVAFPDEEKDNNTFAPNDPDLLKNRPLVDRIIVISAGVVANLIFAYALLFTQVCTVGIVQQELLPGVTVPRVIPGGAGEKGGMKDGDIIVEIEGRKLAAAEVAVSDLVGVVKDRAGKQVKLVVQRGDALKTLTIVPGSAYDGTGKIAVQLSANVRAYPVRAESAAEASLLAGQEVIRLGSLVTDGLKQLFLNFGQAAERLSGPVAIVAVGAEVARTSAAGLFQFAAIVNLNLAVVNILPLPALDGGFLALLLLEGLRGGRKLPEDVERAIMSSGLLLLLTTGVFLIVRDTVNLGIFSGL